MIHRILILLVFAAGAASAQQWYKGNTHAHSLWSDGNDFAESIIDWYHTNGYHFATLSDHNTLSEGERWMKVADIDRRSRGKALPKLRARFGDDWVVARGEGGKAEVRLRRLDEFRGKFEKEGAFLVLQSEEVTASYGPPGEARRRPVHLNAVNTPERVLPINFGASIRDVLRRNLKSLQAIEKRTGTLVLGHLNHPNYGWAFTGEDLGHVVEERFFEVYNGHPGINHLGDANHPGDERIWDIANSLRLGQLDAAPVYGVATDDSHQYHGGKVSPGRGWVMVRAAALEGDALVAAMRAGDFYASSGVTLESLDYDAESRTLRMSIKADGDAVFTTQWIGTRRDQNAEIGEVFETRKGRELVLAVPDDALYARATVTSTRAHPNPSFKDQKAQAWTQPVGWIPK